MRKQIEMPLMGRERESLETDRLVNSNTIHYITFISSTKESLWFSDRMGGGDGAVSANHCSGLAGELLMRPHCAAGVYDDRNIPFPFPTWQFIARNYITFPLVQSNIGQIWTLPRVGVMVNLGEVPSRTNSHTPHSLVPVVGKILNGPYLHRYVLNTHYVEDS